MASDKEFLNLWEVNSVEEGLRKVKEIMGAGLVVVKEAEKGAVGMSAKGDLVRGSAFRIEPINTVGSGDSFNAGFLKAQMLGYDLDTAILFANATAVLNISMPRIPSLQEVVELYTTRV